MNSVNPKLLIALVAVIAFAIFIKISNPHRKYSSEEFWETATVESAFEVPDEALKPGNRNGGVLMWAAMGASNPDILDVLVERGAEINEADGVFMGTPLTGAAGYSDKPKIIDRLVKLGADVNQLVNNDEDALMVAAQYNFNPDIVERLLRHGANKERKNAQGRTALDLAIKNRNSIAQEALE